MAKLRVEISWRYGVVGIYRDRFSRTVRIYPVPFVRISFVRSAV